VPTPGMMTAAITWGGAAHPQLRRRTVDAPTKGARRAYICALLSYMVASNDKQRGRLLLHMLKHQLHHLGDGDFLR
jgi:hypothetical protein